MNIERTTDGADNTYSAKSIINNNQNVANDGANNKIIKMKNYKMKSVKIENIIIKNCRMFHPKQYMDSIGMLKKDIKEVENQKMLAIMSELFNPIVTRDGDIIEFPTKYSKYVYFTIPVNKVKKELYKRMFNPFIKDGPLNKASRAKITPVFEKALTNLGIVPIRVPSPVLKQNNISSIFKVDISIPTFKLLIENERLKNFGKRLSFTSQIGNHLFSNTYSRNEEHPRVYNMFTQMPSSIRQHVFKNIYGVDMVEIDLTNSIVQCLASRGKCKRILDAIKTNTLLPTDKDDREKAKENLLKWIFTVVSPNENMRRLKTQRKNELKEFLSERFLPEVIPFIQALENLESNHTLFHYEDILREFCKQNQECINIHDAVYIPADRTDLINSLKEILDSNKYCYKVNAL